MSTQSHFSFYKLMFVCTFALFLILPPNQVTAINTTEASLKGDSENYTEYKGKIIDKKNGNALAYAGIIIVGTNISTISNSEGEFSIKVPNDLNNPELKISYIGYINKSVPLAGLKSEKNKIELESTSVQLPELNVISKNADEIIRNVLQKKGENYFNTPTLMTAFYRETIKKNRSYVSLAEAVVEINKQSYTNHKDDAVRLYKARKKADYDKLDTLTFKLQGGPYSSLYLDIMKYPEFVFTYDMLANYEFTFDHTIYADNKLIYVIDFKQRDNKNEPLYYGKLYIDSQNMALKSAVFSLNLTDKVAAADLFIKKKPFNARVYPTEAKYRIDFLEKDGKWYYSYSRIELGLKIIWKKKLFNTNYLSTVEMAVTDWGKSSEDKSASFSEKLKPTVIIADEASGFTDSDFWGEYNVIEPEKSIESAIKKIQKKLEKK